MSSDTGTKRSIDDIQDHAEDMDSGKVPSQDADKEQRVTDTKASDDAVVTETTVATATETTTTTQIPTPTNDVQRSSSSKVQERQRGQRLFGMLMGTLNKFDKAQKDNEEQARKRRAIDTKQQERLSEEKKAIRATMLQNQENRTKRNQQRQADLDENRVKQEGLQRKNLAHYLITTTTTTRLTYLPKQLLPHQQEQIDRQIRDAEITEPGVGNDQDQQDKEQ